VERSVATGVAVVSGVFAASRLAYYALGVRFDVTPLDFFLQYPDPLLLRTDLIRTTYYLHISPPLYDVFLGVILKVFGGHYGTALHAVYLLAGLLLAVSMYLLMRSLGASQLPSVLLTSIFIASPATVLYENWLYPDYLIAALLPLMAWLVGRAVTRRSTGAMIAFFALAGLIVLSRSFYHLGWLILVAAIVLAINGDWRRRIVLAAALPVLLCALLYVKNDAVFGFFSGSSAYGGQLSYGTTFQLTGPEMEQLRSSGTVSALSYDAPSWFAARPDLLDPKTGVPVLDERVKSTGAPNWNNRGYLEVWTQYSRDGVATAKARPVVLLRAARMGLLILFVPSDGFNFASTTVTTANVSHVSTLQTITDMALYGQQHRLLTAQAPESFRNGQLLNRLREVGWFIVLAYLVGLGYGIRLLVTSFRQRARPELKTMLAFVLFTIAYILVIDVPLGIPDNNRYRFMADPLLLALVAVALTALSRRVRLALQERQREVRDRAAQPEGHQVEPERRADPEPGALTQKSDYG
jgi:hypothetical protein